MPGVTGECGAVAPTRDITIQVDPWWPHSRLCSLSLVPRRPITRLVAPVALLVSVAFSLVAVLVAACAVHALISTGPDGLRTFAVVRNPDGSSVACAAFGCAFR